MRKLLFLPLGTLNFLPASLFVGLILMLSLVASTGNAQPPERLEFTRLVAHWANYAGDDYLPFIQEAQPELAQFGFYGGHFWSLAHTPQYKGYPAHFPVRGLHECGEWFQKKNQALHKANVKVIGHFNVEFLVGDPDGPDGPRGFFKFYHDHWDEKVLGPKPVKDPLELLERGADGKPIINQSYSIGGMKEYWACLRNPHWQQVMKAWVKNGIDRGVDGYIANYFYKHDCHCEHCQKEFRGYLDERFSKAELKEKFAIQDLQKHKFSEMVYWYKPEETTPLRQEMLRWSQISNKQVFDEVFQKYGRSLKKDLIVAQWNHLGNFSQIRGDERCMLPAEHWGTGEDYLWYSMGGAGNYTDLEQNFFGDGTLQARYIRGAFDDKPYTLGKYEITRIRAAIAELAANGGAPMGFYTRFTDPEARKVIVQYYQFLKKHDALFRANKSHAEVLLLFPRKAVHGGDVSGVETFRTIGKQLLDDHVLFDVLPDDLATPEQKAGYQVVLSAENPKLPGNIRAKLSSFKLAPSTRVSVSKSAGTEGLALHLVNYNREEPPKVKGKPSPGGGISQEKPIPVNNASVDLSLPEKMTVGKVTFVSPENPEPQPLKFRTEQGRLLFDVPEFLVYGVVQISPAKE